MKLRIIEKKISKLKFFNSEKEVIKSLRKVKDSKLNH